MNTMMSEDQVVRARPEHEAIQREHQRREGLERVHGALVTLSNKPPPYPATSPSGTAISIAMAMTCESISIETRRADQPAEVVAAEMVGSEPDVTRGASNSGDLVVRVVGRDQNGANTATKSMKTIQPSARIATGLRTSRLKARPSGSTKCAATSPGVELLHDWIGLRLSRRWSRTTAPAGSGSHR